MSAHTSFSITGNICAKYILLTECLSVAAVDLVYYVFSIIKIIKIVGCTIAPLGCYAVMPTRNDQAAQALEEVDEFSFCAAFITVW